jgi:hypothetical protein
MSAQTTPTEPSTPVGAREARLVSVLSRARRRTAVVPTERWLLALGGGLILAGIVLVVIGWVGTSRSVLVAGQIPYVVSGGLLGLGLIFLGGFLYFGYWLALLFRDGRARGEREEADLARMAQGLELANDTLARIAELLVAERRRTNGSTTRQRSRSS